MTAAVTNADPLRIFGADLGDAILLSGFSGACVILGRSGPHSYVVRKAADAPSLNHALQDQVRRQVVLRERLDQAVRVPAVLGEGEREGRYFFDMEFVPSRAASAYLSQCSLAEVRDFAAAVEGLMDRMADQPPLLSTSARPCAEVVQAKLRQIDERTSSRFGHPLGQLIDASHRAAALLPSAEVTSAHGDLTLENILIDRDGGLCLIDPIASPFDHYWMDWAKLFQDCEGEWFLHRGQRIEPGICHWLRERLYASACARSTGYAVWHYLLLGLTFARILPYTRTDDDVKFVSQRVYRFTQLTLDRLERIGL